MKNQEPRTKNQEYGLAAGEPPRAVGHTYSYRNHIMWQKAQELTLSIVRACSSIPRNPVADTLTRQILRSSSSVAANIAEGHGRYTPAAHANHLSIAKGSACETDSWIDLLHRSGYITTEEEAAYHAQRIELIAMLTSKIRELGKLSRQTHVREESGEYDE